MIITEKNSRETFSGRLAAISDTHISEVGQVLSAIDRLNTPAELSKSGLVSIHGLDVTVASQANLRRSCWRIVYAEYRRKGFIDESPDGEWKDLFDALPETTTYLARSNDRDIATMTAFVDGPSGLPADAIYFDELHSIRKAGRRICEFGRLAHLMADSGDSLATALALFRYGVLNARYFTKCDDIILTVNPRHVGFYTRRLLFDIIGSERPLDKVNGAPAVLLHLDLITAEERYLEKYGQDIAGLWNFFCNPPRIAPHIQRIFLQNRQLDPMVIHFLFGDMLKHELKNNNHLAHLVEKYSFSATDHKP